MADNAAMNTATAKTEDRPADRTLVIERVFKASPEKVFKAWTDPAILVKWWGPEGFDTPECKMDVRAGGKYRTTMVSPDGKGRTVSGVYREISPPKRLVMTWGWEEDGQRGHETVIEVTFEPASSGTKMRLVQSVFENENSRDMHGQGWTSSFNDLERVLSA
jgi:glutathione S-transferase